MEFKFTKEKIDSRKSDYICFTCGDLFLIENQIEYRKNNGGSVVTCHEDNCGLCGNLTTVTNIRNFNYLRIPKQFSENGKETEKK